MDIEVIKIKLPFGPEYAYTYLIDSRFLIDAGYSSKKIAEELHSKTEAKDVLITHHHIDHVGLVFFKGIDAYLHPVEIKLLRFYSKPEEFLKPYYGWAERYGIDKELLKPLEVFGSYRMEVRAKLHEIKSSFEGLKPVYTPGHSPGHLSFYSDGVLFSGDAVLSETTTHVGYSQYSQDPMGDHIATLEKLREMEISVIYPAHENPIRNPEKRISELIDHYQNRIREIYEILEKRPLKVEEVAAEVRWSIGNYDKFDAFNKLLAISETIACLKHLVTKSMAREVEFNGIFCFVKAK